MNANWPFDDMAVDYDQEFTNSTLGRIYRNKVWQRMQALYTGRRHILELGCGTGEDALFLAGHGHQVTALDASAGMIGQAMVKLAQTGLQERVNFRTANLDNLPSSGSELWPGQPGKFTGVLANFGVLNCVEDLSAIAGVLHHWTAPGAPALFTIMGPCVPWEWLWFLLTGRPGKIFRRFHKGGVRWRGITVQYPGTGKARDSFSPYFQLLRITAMGTFLPPSYAESWARKHPGFIRRMQRLERRLETSAWMVRLADHYIMELVHLG